MEKGCNELCPYMSAFLERCSGGRGLFRVGTNDNAGNTQTITVLVNGRWCHMIVETTPVVPCRKMALLPQSGPASQN